MQSLDNKYPPLPVYFLPFLATISALSPLSIDAYLPAFPMIAKDFGVNPLDVNFTMSTYLVGLALGQLLGGPISDQIGRKRIGLLGLSIYFSFTLLILFSSSLMQLSVLRAFQALGGGMASSIVMATIRDVSAPEKAASRIAVMVLFMLLAPMAAPVIGVLLMEFGWRFIFGFLWVYSGVVTVVYFFGFKETRISETKRPDFLKIFEQYKAVLDHRLEGQKLPIKYAVSSGLCIAIMMIYLTNASFMFQTYYAVSESMFVMLFVINVCAFAAGQSFSVYYLRGLSLEKTARYFRLGQHLQLASTLVWFISVLVFDPPLWYSMILLGLSVSCIGLVGPSGQGVYLAAFSKLSGSAAAIFSVGMFIFGSIVGAISGLFRTGDLVPLCAALFGTTLVANLIVLSISRAKETRVMEKISRGEIEPL